MNTKEMIKYNVRTDNLILFFIWRYSCPERRGHRRCMGDIKILHLLLDIIYNNILNTVQDFATIEAILKSHGGSEAGRAYLKADIYKRALLRLKSHGSEVGRT